MSVLYYYNCHCVKNTHKHTCLVRWKTCNLMVKLFIMLSGSVGTRITLLTPGVFFVIIILLTPQILIGFF